MCLVAYPQGAALLALQHPAHAAETLFGGAGNFLAGDDAALAEHVNLQLFGEGARTDGFDEYDTQDLPHLKTGEAAGLRTTSIASPCGPVESVAGPDRNFHVIGRG